MSLLLTVRCYFIFSILYILIFPTYQNLEIHFGANKVTVTRDFEFNFLSEPLSKIKVTGNEVVSNNLYAVYVYAVVDPNETADQPLRYLIMAMTNLVADRLKEEIDANDLEGEREDTVKRMNFGSICAPFRPIPLSDLEKLNTEKFKIQVNVRSHGTTRQGTPYLFHIRKFDNFDRHFRSFVMNGLYTTLGIGPFMGINPEQQHIYEFNITNPYRTAIVQRQPTHLAQRQIRRRGRSNIGRFFCFR